MKVFSFIYTATLGVFWEIAFALLVVIVGALFAFIFRG